MGKVLVVEGLGKRFKRYHRHKPNTIMRAVLSGLRNMRPMDEFWVLKDVSFAVEAGEVLGILGRNGAGKSTLLQLLGGVGKADAGRVCVNGRIGALLDMGAGFHSDLSGRENLVVTGMIAGLTKRQILSRLDQIVEFAELGQFIDSPMRTYSSGMRMRLAFSIAIHNDPDLLLVDEHLSVGDIGFKAKCIERIEQLRAGGCAIVLISQSPEQIQELCDRAILLNQGQVVVYDVPSVVRKHYELQMGTFKPNGEGEIEGDFSCSPLRIVEVRRSPSHRINSGDPLSVEIEYASTQAISAPMVSLNIVNHKDEKVFTANAPLLVESQVTTEGSGKITMHIERLDLPGSEYHIHCGIHSSDWQKTYDHNYKQHSLIIHSGIESQGHINPPYRWERMRKLSCTKDSSAISKVDT